MTKAFTFKTWFSRTVGIAFVTSAGLFAGTEGPFAHLGAIISSGFPLIFQCKGLTFPSHCHTPQTPWIAPRRNQAIKFEANTETPMRASNHMAEGWLTIRGMDGPLL